MRITVFSIGQYVTFSVTLSAMSRWVTPFR
jgi:hypothetical protein